MNCYQPMWLESQKIFVPCGHCFSCRQAKSSEWSVRLQLELADHPSAGFLTLTYDDEHRPWSLQPDDLKNFWKKLRKYRKVRYFACGEYGRKPPLFHAHYHAIVFGLEPNLVDRILVNKLWCKGRTSIDVVTRDSINYVCGYVMKKYSKVRNKLEYEKIGRIPPFQRCSHGLGLAYALAHGSDLSRCLSVRLSTGREFPLPRYFVKKLGIDTELLKAKAKDSMVKFISALFRKAHVKLDPTVESLGYMLFHSKNFRAFDVLSYHFAKINEQKSYDAYSRLEVL